LKSFDKTDSLTGVRRNFLVFLAILAIKVILLLADFQPGYFLGDSESYLAAATIKYIPADRSFLYGLLMRRIARPAHSLELMIVIQVVLSAIAAWLLWWALTNIFAVRFRIALLFAVLCSIEPLQLLYEHYVLTETCATFLFALHFVLALLYLKRGKWAALVASQAIGVLLIGFRISFLPIVLVNSVLVPLLSPYAVEVFRSIRSKGISLRQIGMIAMPLGASLLVSQSLMTTYEHWYGKLIRREPAIFYADGAFLVSDFAPLIEPEDLPVPAKRDSVFNRLKYDRHDPATRAQQHFGPGGLWDNIATEFPNEKTANDIARYTAMHAVLRQPLKALRLGLETFIQYFDIPRLRVALTIDEGGEGDAQMGDQAKGWLRDYFGVADPQQYRMSLTKRWHLAAMAWYWLILLSLVLSPLLFLVRPKSERALILLCTVAALLFFIGATITVDHPTPRFLTSAAWLVLLMLSLAT
jgi:hypothetical protein